MLCVLYFPLVQSCHINRMGLHVQPVVPSGLGQFFHGSSSWSWTLLHLVKTQEFSLISSAKCFNKILIKWGKNITEINSHTREFHDILFQATKGYKTPSVTQWQSYLCIFTALDWHGDHVLNWLYIYLILFTMLWATILCFERLFRIKSLTSQLLA